MKILFILNPKSGKKETHPENMFSCIHHHFPNAEIHLTKGPGHATELAHHAAEGGVESVVAIGGDGTLNETAKGLLGTQTALGVIPRGSGNGFARELGRMLPFEEAVANLQQARIISCDVGKANGELFLNLAGVGIEAEIAWKFMEHGKTGSRGMWPYFKIGARTLLSYRPPEILLTFEKNTLKTSPLTLVFANGKQYGSNFKIAPGASLSDGWLDMVSVEDAPKWKLALAMPSFFTDKWRPFGVTHTQQVKRVLIQKPGEITYHIDGEPRRTSDRLEICIEEKALKVLFPEK